MLSVNEMVTLLRQSVNIQNAEAGEGETIDPAYLAMTDDDIKLFLKLGASRASEANDLEHLEDSEVYPTILLAQIELYTKLAVMKANQVDMGADNNNYLKQSQRFDHYMKLVSQVQAEYENWLENEGQGKVQTYDVLLSNRHYTHRNYEKQVTPIVTITIESITSDSVKFSWKMKNTSHFGRYKVYISTEPIIDMFRDGMTYSDKIIGEPKLIKSTDNIRDVSHSVEGLTPETTYYLAVFSIERNQVFGCSQTMFITLAELKNEEDVSTTKL